MRFSLKITVPALLSSVAIFFSAIPSTSANPPKSGAQCAKVGLTKNYQGKKYTCIKSGKKLVWSKGTTIQKTLAAPTSSPSPTPTPTSSPTPTPTSSPTPTPTSSPTISASPEPKPGQACATEGEIARNAGIDLTCRRDFFWSLKWSTPEELHGVICSKENERIRNSLDEFRCMRWNETTLRWNTTLRFRNPYPRPSLPVVNYQVNQYFEPKVQSAAIETCKIKENSDQGNLRGDLASGFPIMSRYASYPRDYKMALVPIDFSDLEGDKDFRIRMEKEMKMMSDWYADVSGGKMKISWVVSDKWIRLPGISRDYFVEYSGKYPDTEDFWKKVLPVVDSQFDLTGVQTINFILPLNQKIVYESVQSFSFLSEMKKYNSNKSKLYSFSLAGEVFEAPENNHWSYWAHEFGHEIGLAHVGSSRGEVEPMNGYDLLGNQNGPYRELSGWLRFVIGWLEDSQAYCQDTSKSGTNEVSLVPLNDSKNGIKMVVIPTGAESAIIIESRRPTKYACNIPNLPGGVIVYTYDAKLSNQSYFLKAHYPSDRTPVIRCEAGVTVPDVLLKTGDSVKVGNYEISVTSLGTFDQIKIVKN